MTIDSVRANDGRQLWEAARRQSFDRVVLIRPGVSSNFPFVKPSFGLMERSAFGVAKRCVYAAFVVDVYDVSTGKSIAWEWGGENPCETQGYVPEFKPSFKYYTADDQALLRRGVEQRIDLGLAYALKQLSLLPPDKAAP